MDKATQLHIRAKQEADKYIKDNWGSMAFENLLFDVSLYNHWLAYHDAYIDKYRLVEK
jgi:hypothetical protein